MKNLKISVGGHKKVFPTEIIYLKGDANYSQIYLANGKQILVSTTLKTLESRFLNLGFFRTHKSSLINLSCIKSYVSYFDGGQVELSNNEIITVSRRRNRILRALISVKP